MRKLLAVSFVFLPFVAGCIAYGSESVATHSAVGLSLESLLIVYGPMAGMLIWFMYREKVREENAGKRDEELRGVIVKSTEATTLVIAAIAELRAESQKNRVATYQLRDEMRGNTRIIHRDGSEP